jgi:ESCRT-I complex subunit VPS37
MRLRHSTSAQDDASEAVASAFIDQPPQQPQASFSTGGGGTPNSGMEVDEFVKEFKDLRKVYHKRAMWGERWANGQVAWRDD